MKEEWRPVLGFEEIYEVANTGKIRRIKTGCILKPSRYKGYPILCLNYSGKQYGRRLHRVVAQAFIPNPFNLPDVNHKNGIKDDNQSSNLEWMTKLDNTKHARMNDLWCLGEQHHSHKLTWEQVTEIRTRFIKGNGRKLAKEFGVGQTAISKIVTFKTWKESVYP